MKMMKTLKKSALAVCVAAGFCNTNAQAKLVSDVSFSTEQISQLSSHQSNIDEVFANVTKLASSLKKLNEFIIQHKGKAKKDPSILVILNVTLKLTSQLLLEKFHTEIVTTYRKEFRAFSSARSTFHSQVTQLLESINGEKISRKFKPFTAQDIAELEKSLDGRG